MKLLSLFSGIGAFEKALDNLEIPYELIAYCEIDKYASKSYSAIHGVPESMNLGDITKVDEKALPKDIDLVCYGFPCQDISLSGKMRGMFNEDGSLTRSGLFFEALRIIEETQPKVAIAENVKNLTSKKFSEQFKIVLDSLEQAGYNNYWQVLNAKDYIPQNRERVFIISIRNDIDTGTFEFPKGIPLNTTLKDIIENIPYEKALTVDEIKEYGSFYTIPRGSDGKLINGSYNRVWKVNKYCGTINLTKKQEIGEVINNTLYKRELSALECWRLQGFDDKSFHRAEAVNKSAHLFKQAGNSICVPVAEHIINALMNAGVFSREIRQPHFIVEGQMSFTDTLSFDRYIEAYRKEEVSCGN